ncbi:hypothetical protein NC652_038926 [Populus alba x Populus x berolinensis]|nr:hypothetical protein NC652_038920 [Populus alba x Populus x berolinensis]KAJ6861942.1 hypothetical protein NC652_038926 [Populus alba x Populus x berolinensis]
MREMEGLGFRFIWERKPEEEWGKEASADLGEGEEDLWKNKGGLLVFDFGEREREKDGGTVMASLANGRKSVKMEMRGYDFRSRSGSER